MIDRIKQDRARWCHTRTLRVLGKADPAHHNSDRAGRPVLGGALLRPQFLRERQPPRKRKSKYQAQGVPTGDHAPPIWPDRFKRSGRERTAGPARKRSRGEIGRDAWKEGSTAATFRLWAVLVEVTWRRPGSWVASGRRAQTGRRALNLSDVGTLHPSLRHLTPCGPARRIAGQLCHLLAFGCML